MMTPPALRLLGDLLRVADLGEHEVPGRPRPWGVQFVRRCDVRAQRAVSTDSRDVLLVVVEGGERGPAREFVRRAAGVLTPSVRPPTPPDDAVPGSEPGEAVYASRRCAAPPRRRAARRPAGSRCRPRRT